MTGVPQAIASTAGKPNPFHERRQDQGIRTAVKKHEIFVGDKSGHDHAVVHMVSPGDGRADLGDVGVEDVVNIAGEHEQDVRRRALGEGFDQAKQVLVRAQAADIKQIARRRAEFANRRRTASACGLAGREVERSGRGLR